MFSGIFLDLDLQCLRPLDPLRQFEFVSVAAKPTGISNGFLMSSPRHPFLKNVVDNLPRYNINWFGLPYATVMFSTGCHFLSYVGSVLFASPPKIIFTYIINLMLIHSGHCMPSFPKGMTFASYGAQIVFTNSLAPSRLHSSDISACHPGIRSMEPRSHLRCLFLSL